MIIHHSDRFQKNFRKRIASYPKLTQQFRDRLQMFLKNPNHPLLNNHQLKGKLGQYRAISITGDIRLVYNQKADALLLYDIGTHNQVYR